MSEEKMYAIKNDEGDWADTRYVFGYGAWVTPDKNIREEEAKHHGGHVVTLIEEPEKVVVSPEEAELVKSCLWTNLQDEFLNNINLLFRGRRPEDITRLKSALTNGYAVAKEKKYNVKVPHTEDVWYYKSDDGNLRAIGLIGKKLRGKFTEAEIEHYGLQDCERVKINTEE